MFRVGLSRVGRKTRLLSILLKHISRAGVGAMEVETASGHVLGARSIRQAMADANLYAEGTTCGSNRILALCFTFSIAAPLTGSCAPTHVAKIHNECAAQIRPGATRGVYRVCSVLWLAICVRLAVCISQLEDGVYVRSCGSVVAMV